MKKNTSIFVLIVSTILLVNTVYSQTAPTPLAAYNFEEDASDEMGNFDGTLEKDATIENDGARGKVLVLNDSGYVSLPATIADSMDNFSFAAWLKYNGTKQWAGPMGMGKLAYQSFPYWDFHINNQWAHGGLSFYSTLESVWPSDGCAQQVSSFNIVDDTWTHIILSFTLNTGAEVYVNGQLQETVDWVGTNDFDVSPKMVAPEIITIGRDAFNQGTLDGSKIDDFRFYNIAVTADDAIAIYEGKEPPTSVEEKITQIKNYSIAQNHPNPFKMETTIKFNISENSKVKLSIYNIYGQEIAVLVDGFRNAGAYSELFNGENLSSGVYFYRLESNGYYSTKRMLLSR